MFLPWDLHWQQNKTCTIYVASLFFHMYFSSLLSFHAQSISHRSKILHILFLCEWKHSNTINRANLSLVCFRLQVQHPSRTSSSSAQMHSLCQFRGIECLHSCFRSSMWLQFCFVLQWEAKKISTFSFESLNRFDSLSLRFLQPSNYALFPADL